MVHEPEAEGYIVGTVADAGCAEDDEEGLGRRVELGEGSDYVGAGVAAEGDRGHGFTEVNDADAGDDHGCWAVVEAEGAADLVGIEDIALGDGEVGGEGGFGDAALEEERGEFGWGTGHWRGRVLIDKFFFVI